MNPHRRTRHPEAGPCAAEPHDPSGPDTEGGEPVADLDHPDAPDARDRGPGPRDGEQTLSDASADGIEGVHETAPDEWIESDPTAADDGAPSRRGAP